MGRKGGRGQKESARHLCGAVADLDDVPVRVEEENLLGGEVKRGEEGGLGRIKEGTGKTRGHLVDGG